MDQSLKDTTVTVKERTGTAEAQQPCHYLRNPFV